MTNRRARQLELDLGADRKARREHGGGLRTGKRKLARPFDRHRALHVTMRARDARQSRSLLFPERALRIQNYARAMGRRHGVRICEYANVGNHLHFVLKARSRKGFQDFLRTVAAFTAILVTGAKKGQPTGPFWDGLAYSKVVEWGKMLESAAEAAGLARRVDGRQMSAGHLFIEDGPS